MGVTTSLKRLDWKPPPADDRRRQRFASTSPLRDPARALTVLGAGLMVLGCCMPWAFGIDGLGQSVGYSASGGNADGVLLIVFALVIAGLTGHPIALDSRSRSFQVAPLVLAAVSAMVWVSGAQSARTQVNDWIRGGGSGDYAFGLWVTLMGIAIAARGSAWVDERRSPQVRAETHGFRQEWVVNRSGLLEGIFGTVFALAGGVLGMVIPGLFGAGGSNTSVANGAVFFSIILLPMGVAVGAGVGVRVGRFVLRRLGSPDRSPFSRSRP